MIIVTFKLIGKSGFIEINKFGKVEIFPYASVDQNDGLFQKINFDFPKNTISIIQSSPFTPTDRIILEPTNVDMIHWVLNVDGEIIDDERFNGVKSMDYIKDFYDYYHLGIDTNFDSASLPPKSPKSPSKPSYQFDQPITIDGTKLSVAATVPLDTEIFKFFAKTTIVTNPSTDLNGDSSLDELPNYLIKNYNITTGDGKFDIQLNGLSYENGFVYGDLVGLEFRVAFYNSDILSWIYSNVIVLPAA